MKARHSLLHRLARRPLALALTLLGHGAASAAAIDPVNPEPAPDPAPQATFNPTFLYSSGTGVDLSRFERGNVTLAGTYRPTVIVNGETVPGTRPIAFRQVADSESAKPCFDRAMLVGFGLDMAKLAERSADDASVAELGDAPFCGSLATYVPGSTVDFDESEQVLRITLPQAFVRSHARGFVDPSYWDAGETTASLNYSANTFQVRRDGRRSTSTFVGVQAGANIGGWRLRQSGAFTAASGQRAWRNTLVYAQHDLTDARAQLTVGETYTSGDILDSVRVRGVSIVSDPRMLPASQRGYAPVIRGVAESNAQVSVSQNGYVIHSVSVAPGAFEIDDLYPTGYGSDLEVTITEADGRTKHIVVPYTSVPQMLREGSTRFAFWGGQVDETTVRDTPFIAQVTAQYGVTNNVTAYAGSTASNSYWSGLAGIAVNTPIGAFAFDVTGSRAALRRDGIRRGLSSRLRYTRTLTGTGTNIGVVAQRFSTRDYLGVVDAARLRSDLNHGLPGGGIGGERSRFDVTVAQNVGSGRLSLAGSLVDYWGRSRRSLNYTLGYANTWRTVGYNISVQRSRMGDLFAASRPGAARDRGTDTTVYFSFYVPLGAGWRAPNLGVSHRHGNDGDASSQATVNGRLDRDGDLTYALAATRSASRRGDTTHSGSATMGYRSGAGTYRVGVGRGSQGTTQYSLAASGAVVAHRDGVTFSQELGETNGIIHAPGAAGARVESHAGVRLDRRGNAVIRSLMPYQLNTVSVDPRGTSHDVELESTSETVAPRAGAFVRLEYHTSIADSLLIEATRPDGTPLPFGASVLDDEGQAVGVVGQASKIFARGALAGKRLTVSWGDSDADRCRIDVPTHLDDAARQGTHRATRAACTSGADGLAVRKAA